MMLFKTLLYTEKLTEQARAIFINIGNLERNQCDLLRALKLAFTSPFLHLSWAQHAMETFRSTSLL